MQAIEVKQALPGVETLGRRDDANAGGSHGDDALGASRCGHEADRAGAGVPKNTVKRYLRDGGWGAYRSPARGEPLAGWRTGSPSASAGTAATRTSSARNSSRARHRRVAAHGGARRRAVAPRAARPQSAATVRFETPPGRPAPGGLRRRAASRSPARWCGASVRGDARLLAPPYVRAFPHERQRLAAGIEGAFRHFGGVPEEVLLDNARALVDAPRRGDARGALQRALPRLRRYWGFRPRACAPYRARTKGKDERGVGYVKRNAIAGRAFASWEALEAHLAHWTREVADVRVHGTTGEPPLARFSAPKPRRCGRSTASRPSCRCAS